MIAPAHPPLSLFVKGCVISVISVISVCVLSVCVYTHLASGIISSAAPNTWTTAYTPLTLSPAYYSDMVRPLLTLTLT